MEDAGRPLLGTPPPLGPSKSTTPTHIVLSKCANRGSENTFSANLMSLEEARVAFAPIVEKIWRHCGVHGALGRTVTLNVKYADFQLLTRSRTGLLPVSTRSELETTSLVLLASFFPTAKGIRLLGVSLSS